MRKKIVCLLLFYVMMCALCACGKMQEEAESRGSIQNDLQETQEAPETAKENLPGQTDVQADEEGNPEQGNILIAYFTWAENADQGVDLDAVSSASDQAPGNVGQMALWIQQRTGGDLFSIQAEEPYPADYDECLNRAADEKAENARPALKNPVEDLSGYDTVFIGFPNWWYTAPMAIFSFLEDNDLAGKKVILFCSHGTGGLASSVKDITAALPDSDIEENVLGIYRDDIAGAEDELADWLAEIGF